MLFFFVCRHQGRVSFRNHVPKDFSIVAAFPDLYPSTTEISIPNLWKQYHRPPETRQEENYSLPEYWPFLPIFHCFFFFTLLVVVQKLLDLEFESDSATQVLMFVSVLNKSLFIVPSLHCPILCFSKGYICINVVTFMQKLPWIDTYLALNWYLFGQQVRHNASLIYVIAEAECVL